PEGVSRYENIEELLGALKEFSTPPDLLKGEDEYKPIDLPELVVNNEVPVVQLQPPTSNLRTLDVFMSDIALLTDTDKKEDPANRDHVSLMTIHQAKGLEFVHVFIVGLEENLFPNSFSMNSRDDLEEERRLFYVALTRAQKKSILTFAATRFHRGSLINTEPSRFIEEIDAKYVEFTHSKKDNFEEQRGRWNGGDADTVFEEPVFRKSEVRSQKSEVTPKNPIPNPKKLVNYTIAKHKSVNGNQEHLKNLQIGTMVSHERFGNGKVINMEGQFPNSKATVHFESAGQKQLLLKFAKLEIVE
ncbi:MAG: 3'-5' exonuclease, partial [Bacteroidota bacterium]